MANKPISQTERRSLFAFVALTLAKESRLALDDVLEQNLDIIQQVTDRMIDARSRPSRWVWKGPATWPD